MNTLKLVNVKVLVAIMAGLMMLAVLAPRLALAQDNVEEGDVFGTKEIGDPKSGIALGKSSLQKTVVRLINVALSLLGIIAVVIVLIGGFKWMTAGGNDEKVAEARKLIFAGIVGMAIILSAWAIARFVLSNLASATDTRGTENSGLDDVEAAP